MIIWINGAFGAGKTTTSGLLHRHLPESILFDPEEVGFVLRRSLPKERPDHRRDFQDYPMWRHLVGEFCVSLHEYLPDGHVIVPMTLLNRAYAHEIFAVITANGIPLRHVVLHTATTILIERINSSSEFPEDEERSEKVRAFRRKKITDYETARSTWLTTEADTIDTTDLDPADVTDHVLKLLHLP